MAARSSAETAGYTVDLVYPSSFVLGQTPLQLQWAAVNAGAAPETLTGPFTYCDLGCGDGSTLCLLAACYPRARFVGIDVNAEHIALGRHRAARAGITNLELIETSFADLDALELPAFDYVVAYGIYSWLAPEMQQAIDRFARRRLRPGGLFAVHYSSLPGCAVHDPLSHYLRSFGATTVGDSATRFSAGLATMRRLAPASRFFEQNPQAQELLRSTDEVPLGTIAHDVLNRQAHSFYCAEVHERLAAHGLAYLASANVLPDYPELLLTRPAFAAYRELTAASDLPFREAVRDFMLNTALRFDLFRKQDPSAPLHEQGLAALGDLYLRRAGSRRDVEARRRWSSGREVDLTSPVHSAVLDLASTTAITIGDVLRSDALKAFAPPDVGQAIRHLFALGFLNVLVERPIEAEYRSERRYRLRSALNVMRLEESLRSTGPEGLASTVLGSPLLIPAFARLQLTLLLGGNIDAAWAASGGAAKGTLEQFRDKVRGSLPRFVVDSLPQLLRFGVIEEDAP
jgi:SAM-dependent methyltransferase